jgi:protein-S-isoprenylcysteine O-methyltransferase Ste14
MGAHSPSGFWGRGVFLLRHYRQLLVFVFLQAVVLFLAAGRINFGEGWAFLGQYMDLIILNSALFLPNDQVLIAESSRALAKTKGWDRTLLILYGAFGISVLAVAGLDRRLGWSSETVWTIKALGWFVMVAAYLLFTWTLASTKFSSVQGGHFERGYGMDVQGPYRYVRHPGYIAIIVYALAAPVMFNAWTAYIPAGFLTAVIVARTLLEDHLLLRQQAGYAFYAHLVRYRLLPGVW